MRVGEPENLSVQADDFKDFIEGSRVLEKIEEDEADCHSVNQVGKEKNSLEEIGAANFCRENDREKKGQSQLDEGADKIVDAHAEHAEIFRPGKKFDVVLNPDEGFLSDSVPLQKAVEEHVEDREESENQKQEQGKEKKSEDDQLLLMR